MNQPNYRYYPPRRRRKKSKFVLFLLIIGIFLSSSLLIPSPGSNTYYLNGNIKSSINEDGTQRVFYPDGVEFYNGEMIEGLSHGYGKYFDQNGTLIYEGQWKNGLIHGYGAEYCSSGEIKYEGQWKNGLYHGEGINYLDNHIPYYSGEWYYGVPFGYGEFYNQQGHVTYKGEVVYGIRHGYGQEFINGSLHYEGLWFEGTYFNIYDSFYLSDGTKLSPSLGRYYKDLIESQGLDAATTIISDLTAHMDIIERSSTNEYFKYLLYQHLELPINYNSHTITAIINEFESLPISIFEDLVELGVKHRFIHGSIANQPEFKDIRESSRGISLSLAVGISSPNHKLLITRLDRGTPPATAVHELGHGVDFFLLDNISRTEAFEEIRKQEAEAMFRNRYLNNNYFIDYPEEYFAEFFAQYFLSEDLRMIGGAKTLSDIKRRAPNTSALFEEKVVNYKSQFSSNNIEAPPLDLAASFDLTPSFTVVNTQNDYIELLLGFEHLDFEHGDRDITIYVISSSSSIQELIDTFNLSMEHIMELLYSESNKLIDPRIPFDHSNAHLLYLIIDEENNYSLGDNSDLFPAEHHHKNNIPTPIKIETEQPLIFAIWGRIKNLFN